MQALPRMIGGSAMFLHRRLTEIGNFGPNPGALRMFTYLPPDVSADCALMVVLSCGTINRASYSKKGRHDQILPVIFAALGNLPEIESQILEASRCFVDCIQNHCDDHTESNARRSIMADEPRSRASVLARKVVAICRLVEGVSAAPVGRERSIANQGIPYGFYKDRISVLMIQEPCTSALNRQRLQIAGESTFQDHLIVDDGDTLKISQRRAPYHDPSAAIWLRAASAILRNRGLLADAVAIPLRPRTPACPYRRSSSRCSARACR